MSLITTTLSMPGDIEYGLASGAYRRFGGTIRETATGRIVALLRDAGPQISPATLGLLQLGSVASTLNLGITVMGFAVVLKRLNEVEQRIRDVHEVLQRIGMKLDIAFYGNVRAALELTTNALTMANAKNREASAMQAINRFTEARHHYAALADGEITRGGQAADEYLATLALAHVAEARCYLELNEIASAHRVLHQGGVEVGTRARRHVETLLTSNVAAYLHPSLRGQVDLHRLTQVLRWFAPDLDENTVFETNRERLFEFARDKSEWIATLPPAIWDPKIDETAQGWQNPVFGRVKLGDWSRGWLSADDDVERRVLGRLPAAMLTMEALIEDSQRLASYEAEIQTMRALGMSFDEWQSLPLQHNGQDTSGALMYIIMNEPLPLLPYDHLDS